MPARAGQGLGHLLRAAARQLAEAGVDEPMTDARLLLQQATGLDRLRLATDPALVPPAAALARFQELVRRRAAREPLAYILGGREFFGLLFEVVPGVLIPRPETELLVETAQALHPDRTRPLRILDLGVGSGCLLLTLLHLYPAATGTGTDREAPPLAVTGRNAERLGVAARLRLHRMDWGRELAGPFDLVLSNPPYVADGELEGLAAEVGAFEPRTALVAGADGLDAYRALAPDAARLLAPAGTLLLEIGQGQGDAAAAILARAGLCVTDRRRDLAGIERCLVATGASGYAPRPA